MLFRIAYSNSVSATCSMKILGTYFFGRCIYLLICFFHYLTSRSKNVKFNVDYLFSLFKTYSMYKYEEVMYGGKISNKSSFLGRFVHKTFNVFNISLQPLFIDKTLHSLTIFSDNNINCFG